VVDRATRIDALAGDISVDLSQVEDKTPAWISMLQWWGIALAAIAILIVLWQSGAFTAIRIAIGWLPRRKVAQAEMAVDMLDPSRPEGDREMVAAMRAQDPVFDAAFRKAQTRRKA
jgi:type II secretory pathway component PulL